MIDVYRIGITVAMSGNAQQFMGVLLRDMMKLNTAATMLNKNFAGLRGAAMGAVAAFAGFKGLEFVWHIVKAGGEWNAEINRTRQLGGEFERTIDMSKRQSVETALAVPTETPASVQKLQRELGLQLGHPEAAAELVTAAAKVALAVSNVTKEKPEDLIKNMVRIADERGQIFSVGPDGKEYVDKAKVMAEMNAAGRGLELTAGYLTSGGALQLARQASLAEKKMTREAFYANMFEMAASFGGGKTGTALTSMGQQLLGGVMPKRVAEADVIGGLLKKGEYHTVRGGGVIINPSAAKRMGKIETDPIGWMEHEGKAAIDQYMKKTGATFLVAVMRMLSRQNVQRLFSQGITNNAQFERARAIWNNMTTPEEQQKLLMQHDLNTNIDAFSKSWATLLQVLGEPAVPVAIAVLRGLRFGIQEVTRAVAANPAATKALLAFTAGISALAVLVGGLKVLDFGLSALAAGLRSLMQVFLGNTLTGGIFALARGLSMLLGPVTLLYNLLHSSPAGPGEDDELKKQGRLHSGVPSGPRTSPTPDQRFHEYKQNLLNEHFEPTYMPMSYRRPMPTTGGRSDILYVHVVNTGDIGRGTLDHITRTLDRPSAGGTNYEPRGTPYGSLMGA